MADQLQLRGGDAAAADAFTGASREVTVDTTNHNLRVHDGVTPGGHLLANIAQTQALLQAQEATFTVANESLGQRITNVENLDLLNAISALNQAKADIIELKSKVETLELSSFLTLE